MKNLRQYIKTRSKPFIIAEMSANHNQSLTSALRIIDHTYKTGAQAIKIQTFLPEKMTLNIKKKDFQINNKDSLWNKKYLYDLYSEAHTPFEWHTPIFEKAKKLDLFCFSSVFDEESLLFLESIRAPAYKIASFENNHFPLIEKVAKTKKPIIISTGLSNLKDIKELIKILQKSNHNNYCLLKCTSNYPANNKDCNLLTIPSMIKEFNCPVGLSDHTLGSVAASTSIALGARIIEKHIKLNDNQKGLDNKFSLNPKEFKYFVKNINLAWISLGSNKLKITESEKKSLIFKRSIYITKNIKKGELFSNNNISIIRPGYGLHPKFYNNIIGKKAKKTYLKGTATSKKMI